VDIPSLLLVIVVVLLSLAIIVLALSGQGSYAERRYQQAGALLSAVLSRREIVVAVGKGEVKETWLFSLAPGARLTIDGQPANLEALTPGDFIEVTYAKQEHHYLALEVAAQGKPQPSVRVAAQGVTALSRPLL
jgi:hypothetical protein